MTIDMTAGEKVAEESELKRYRTESKAIRTCVLLGATGSLLLSMYMIFGVGNILGSYVLLETEYFYLMLALLIPLTFLLFPFNQATKHRLPWFDVVLAATTFLIPAYFAVKGDAILNQGWEYTAPLHAKVLAFVYWAIVLEALRRAGGTAIFAISAVVSVYPVFSHLAPGVLKGQAVAFEVTAGFHIFGTESLLGIPMSAFANLVVGFLVFGVALQYTGGGAFFLNLAFALLGKRRGGPAKVAIFASGLMGSMSGSVITNVLTTGVMSIPAMKRVGFRPAYAAGVEACASTGGVLMPPVMGATAFVMATFLEIGYAEIVIAAAFPSLMYYFGLFLQIDAYSARYGLQGLPAAELPPVSKVLRDGWYFIFVFVTMIIMLLYLQREAQAPYYASAILLVINQTVKQHRWNLKRFMEFIDGVGKLFAELAAVLAGVGLIIGALTLTGKVGSLTYELVRVAGDSVILLLIMGAITSFILGIGMTVTAAYLFLAVTIGPALTQGGLDKLAVHLFLLYWGMISFITPPVAIGAYAAASIAQSNPMKTGFEAMRLGSIIYFVPFFFVLNPALIGQGSMSEILLVLSTALFGILLISSGLQGYLYFVGPIDGNPILAMAGRVMLVIGGLILAMPGNEKIIGFNHTQINAAALIVCLIAIALSWLGKRRSGASPATS
jgi:TRAP transporter 4TM/12TM fusion protein